MRKALIPAFLLVLGSVILGATVLREPLAKAATPFTNVIVGNTSSNPVPVDEQGTADVKVTNSSLPVNVTNSSLNVAQQPPITGGGSDAAVGEGDTNSFFGTVTASAIDIHMAATAQDVELANNGSPVAEFYGPASGGSSDIALALVRPITFDSLRCLGPNGGDLCSVGWVGNGP